MFMHVDHWVLGQSSKKGDEATRNVVKTFTNEFFQKVCCLRNNRGGVLAVHVRNMHQACGPSLDNFDQKVSKDLSDMIEDDSPYAYNYHRQWFQEIKPSGDLPASRHVIVLVKGSSSVSTKNFNTMVPFDCSKERPRAREVAKYLSDDIRHGLSCRKREGKNFLEGKRLDFIESRGVQFKSLSQADLEKDVKEHSDLNSLPEKLAFRLIERLDLLQYISTFTKLEGGGSFFLGIEEEKRQGPSQIWIPSKNKPKPKSSREIGFDFKGSRRRDAYERDRGRREESRARSGHDRRESRRADDRDRARERSRSQGHTRSRSRRAHTGIHSSEFGVDGGYTGRNESRYEKRRERSCSPPSTLSIQGQFQAIPPTSKEPQRTHNPKTPSIKSGSSPREKGAMQEAHSRAEPHVSKVSQSKHKSNTKSSIHRGSSTKDRNVREEVNVAAGGSKSKELQRKPKSNPNSSSGSPTEDRYFRQESNFRAEQPKESPGKSKSNPKYPSGSLIEDIYFRTETTKEWHPKPPPGSPTKEKDGRTGHNVVRGFPIPECHRAKLKRLLKERISNRMMWLKSDGDCVRVCYIQESVDIFIHETGEACKCVVEVRVGDLFQGLAFFTKDGPEAYGMDDRGHIIRMDVSDWAKLLQRAIKCPTCVDSSGETERGSTD